jgi:hypothetical protein
MAKYHDLSFDRCLVSGAMRAAMACSIGISVWLLGMTGRPECCRAEPNNSEHLLVDGTERPATYGGVVVRIGAEASLVERNVAKLLVERLGEFGPFDARLEIETATGSAAQGSLLILLGRASTHRQMATIMADQKIPIPDESNLGPEGYLLQLLPGDRTDMLLAAGVDSRGCLYAVGAILRHAEWQGKSIHFPPGIDRRAAPAFAVRGTQIGQSHVAKQLARVRDWTLEEGRRALLDYALAGANIFPADSAEMVDWLNSYGLMSMGGFGANTGADPNHPEWEAAESIGRKGYLCPSIAQARQALLRKCDDYFRQSPSFDLVKFHGGDGGGCECDRCDPYGATFIHLVEEMAAIVHRYHPRTRIYFTNQKFDNKDDRAVFDYLQAQPRAWLWAWGYGPGSDATTWQPGHRQTHRMDLFCYPGFGPYGLYPREILHQLPPQQVLVYYNEITHWKYAQHGMIQMYPRADRNGDLPPHWSHDIYQRRPDQALTMVYNRLTFFAWPRYYYRVFQDLMPYGVGDITHSSGHHDHFNQWMWQRLLWAPRTSVEDVVDEYCRTWFGPAAALLMAKAIFQLEENLQERTDLPLADKPGILDYYRLVQEAGRRMPPQTMQGNWLWRMYMQKGALDRYVQLAVEQQYALQHRIEAQVASVLDSDHALPVIDRALAWMVEVKETSEMRRLHAEAGRLGDESNHLYGVRSEGYFNLEHDYLGLGWLQRQLQRARAAAASERRELLAMITDYENPGAGGWYDNLGTDNVAPHVEFGYPYDHGQPYVRQMLSEGNRPSQRSMHFTQDEQQGVTLRYDGLDPTARYRIRFTLVRPWYQQRYSSRMNQKTQTIYADDRPLVKDIELPLQMSDFFTFEITPEATRDGELVIRFERAKDVARGDRVSVEQWRNSGGWGTILSEAWLMRR